MSKIEIEINEKLVQIVKDYLYEMEGEIKEKTFNDFVVSAVVEKFNNDNTIFNGEVDENGFTDGRTSTEHYID